MTKENVAPASLSGQKRLRDYGEELKGLTSDEDGEVSSPPAAKKAKMHRDGGDSPAESIDDGEIVESSPSRPVSQDASDMSQAKLAGPPSSGPTLKLAVGYNRGLSLGVRTSFGKGAATPFPAAQPASSSVPVDTISISSSSPTLSHDEQAGNPSAANEPPTTENPNIAPLTFMVGKHTWQIPRSKALDVPQTPDAETPAFWHRKILPFIVTLFRTNADRKWKSLDTKALRVGLDKYVSKDGGFLEGANKHARGVRKALQQATADRTALDSMIKKALQEAEAGPQDQPQPPDPEMLRQNAVSGDEERWQQERYFPNAEDPSQLCISCSGMGHRAKECPQLACRFCKSVSHTSFGCPTTQRCIKCRQLGHDVEACAEKLALAADEQDPCAFCAGSHLEDECSEIWRSYDRDSATIKKVKAIPAFCYTCGGDGHYGPECALPDRGGQVTGRTSWSRGNRDFYVDPKSDAVAIAWVGVEEPSPEFHIRGRATRSTHTHFVSDDDSDDGFIHEPVKRSQGRTQIRIATNIGTGPRGPQSGPRTLYDQGEPEYEPPPATFQGVVGLPPYNGGGAQWQPPLPAGPPPPLQVNGFQGPMASFPAAPPGSLPARPDNFTRGGGRGQSSRSQSYRGGRGNQGRGRGRGRGGRGRGQ